MHQKHDRTYLTEDSEHADNVVVHDVYYTLFMLSTGIEPVPLPSEGSIVSIQPREHSDKQTKQKRNLLRIFCSTGIHDKYFCLFWNFFFHLQKHREPCDAGIFTINLLLYSQIIRSFQKRFLQ